MYWKVAEPKEEGREVERKEGGLKRGREGAEVSVVGLSACQIQMERGLSVAHTCIY